MKILNKKVITSYLFLSGVIAHLTVVGIFVFQPFLVGKLTNKAIHQFYSWQKNNEYEALTQGNEQSIQDEISTVFSSWQAKSTVEQISTNFEVNGVGYSTITAANSALQHGDELLIASGTYTTPIVITKNDITIKGLGHVIFNKGIAQGKGFIFSRGDNLTVTNIECKNIINRDGNGACIRQEGVNLTLNNVFFHSSQEGILETAKQAGFIKVYNSRFERLGHNGQAHGIYTNKASLHINKSLFIAAKSQGHAIKVRGQRLSIENSILVSLSADDSRLIDMSNGGELSVVNSLLGQGPNSVNGQVIGYGLEGMHHQNNYIALEDNLIYLERLGSDYLLALPNTDMPISILQNNNIIIGKDQSPYQSDTNIYFINRAEIGLPIYPYLSKNFCIDWQYCPIN